MQGSSPEVQGLHKSSSSDGRQERGNIRRLPALYSARSKAG